MARALREDLLARFERQKPTAVHCFEEDFDACIAQLQLRVGHRRVARTTNLLERLFGKTRRRCKVAPSVSGERPVLKRCSMPPPSAPPTPGEASVSADSRGASSNVCRRN
jgi:transposase-like protein